MYEFTDATRLGLTWEGKTEYNFDIHTKIYLTQSQDTAFDLPISAQVNTPQQIMLSLYHDVNKYWAIMGNLGWQDWSQYSSSKVIVAGVDVENNGKLKDTWHSSVGLQYRPIEEIRINTGVAYDSSFYHSQHDTSLTMPSGAAWRIGSGIQYQISPTSNIGFAIEYLTMESSYVNSSLFRGKYNNPDMLFFSANMGYKF